MDNQAASPDMGGASAVDAGAPVDDKPFDNEPFDAGVEADEATDPKKYIEQLTGKLGQSLRKYNDGQGHPDFELEKFAINSLLSATHTAEMDEEDKNDIIKKVNTSGDDGGEAKNSEEMNDPDMDDMGGEEPSMDEPVDDDGLNEGNDMEFRAKKCSMFAPKGSPEYMEENDLTESKPCWSGYKQVGMKNKNGKEVPNCVPNSVNENNDGYDFNKSSIESASGDKVVQREEDDYGRPLYWSLTNKSINYYIGSGGQIVKYNAIDGKDVVIGDLKHYKHGDRLEDEMLSESKKKSIFNKKVLRDKLQETFIKEDMTEPTVEPMVKPATKPEITPSRRNKPFTIEPDTVPETPPKALNENLNKLPVYHDTFSSAVQAAGEYAKSKGYELNEDEWFTTIATGPRKPQEGKTNRYTLALFKDGKEQRKALHIQVYGMNNGYELNTYIA